MEKEFVAYEQALALKELGFEEPCFAYYSINNIENKLFYDIDADDGELTALNQNQFYHNNLSEVGRISAPLKQQVFRWFREKHRLSQNTCDWFDDFEFIIFEWTLSEDRLVHTFELRFDTYEEAESACVDKLIELIKNKL